MSCGQSDVSYITNDHQLPRVARDAKKAAAEVSSFLQLLGIEQMGIRPLQVILGWLTDDGYIHERVVTRRIRATLSPSVYLSSVDAPTTVSLLVVTLVTSKFARQYRS